MISAIQREDAARMVAMHQFGELGLHPQLLSIIASYSGDRFTTALCAQKKPESGAATLCEATPLLLMCLSAPGTARFCEGLTPERVCQMTRQQAAAQLKAIEGMIDDLIDSPTISDELVRFLNGKPALFRVLDKGQFVFDRILSRSERKEGLEQEQDLGMSFAHDVSALAMEFSEGGDSGDDWVSVAPFMLSTSAIASASANASAAAAAAAAPPAPARRSAEDMALEQFRRYVRRESPEFQGKEKQTLQNRALLDATVCSVQRIPEIPSWWNVPSVSDTTSLLRQMRPVAGARVSFSSQWFDFVHQHHFYINFAHPTEFGGAYDTFGCVQEERLFAEFPQLPYLKMITGNGVHPCKLTSQRPYPPYAAPTPAIIEGLLRQFDISNVPYGGAFQGASAEQIRRGIRKVEHPVPINLISLAAADFRGGRNPQYEWAHMEYHFMAAFSAYRGAQDLARRRGWGQAFVHTAPWGCGEFLNSENMMTAIQLLAGRMAGVHLIFHGVGNPRNPGYTRRQIIELSAEITMLLAKKLTVEEILLAYLDRSGMDFSWAPKRQ